MTRWVTNRRNGLQGVILIVGLAAILVLPNIPTARAADGDLDTSFGAPNGFVKLPGSVLFRDVAIQPDGKILAAGAREDPIDFGEIPLVARFNTNGTLDPTFGTGGIAEPQFGMGSSTGLSHIALQANGKIVVGGTAVVGGFVGNLYVARLEANGAVDTGFGSSGFRVIDFTNDDILRGGVAIDPSGNILVAGSALFTYTLARLTSIGDLDPTFGTGGKVTTGGGASAAVAALGDGRILVAGETFEVLRFTSSGVLDTTFGGGDGRAGAGFPVSSQAHNMALQTDGRIILVGATLATTLVEALARFNANGTLDSSFGSGGRVTAGQLLPGHRALDVTSQSDGRIVTCGVVGEDDSTGLLSRYHSDGTADFTFGTGGRVLTDLPGNNLVFAGVAVQIDGKIVVAGASNSASSSTAMGIVLRYGGSVPPPPPPPPPSFDICVQNGSKVFSFNTATGAYEFRDCSKGFLLTGAGTITVNSCKMDLLDTGSNPHHPDRNVVVKVNTCTRVGTVSIVTNSPPKTYSYADSDISMGSCTCP